MMSDRKLTAEQRDLLETLFYTLHVSNSPLKWCTPLDLGGHNGSHHSGMLRTLARRGLVQFKQRGARDPEGWENEDERGKRYSSRGSKCYRITPNGCLAIGKSMPVKTEPTP